MSSNLACEFFEIENGDWFYLLEADNEMETWDWRDDAACRGPFESAEEARRHLLDNNGNPGGSTISHYDPSRPLSTVLRSKASGASIAQTSSYL